MTDIPAPLPTLEGIAAFARRHALLTALLMSGGAALGLLVATIRPDFYASTVTVLMDSAARETDDGPVEVTLDTLATLVFSESVVDSVAADAGYDTDTTVDRLSVGAVPVSRLLVIEFVGDEPGQAQSGAQTAAAATIDESEALFGSGGDIVLEASLPTAAQDRNREVLVVSGGLLGLLVAVLWGIATEALRPSHVSQSAHSQEATGMPGNRRAQRKEL